MISRRFAVPLFTALLLAGLALTTGPGPAFADPTVLLPYGATVVGGTPGYKHLILPLNSEVTNFESPDPLVFDDSLWADGIAPFGGPGELTWACPWLWETDATEWAPNNSDLFTRFRLDICPGVSGVKVGIAIDNDIRLFVNGYPVNPIGNCVNPDPLGQPWAMGSDGFCYTEGCAYPDKLVYDVDAFIVPGTNYFAIHARDRHVIGYLDVQVTADVFDPICTPPNDPPSCDDAVAEPGQLWPPNHKWNSIAIGGVTDPNGDPVVVTVDSIFQDEPTDANGNGDGNTCPDGAGIGTDTAEVRAERAGGADGRVYHINFTATDPSGDTCQGSVGVCVPHDQGQGNNCIDQGPLYDSTVCN